MSDFKLWCKDVIPTVFDDSLSYYELLCKVIKELEELGVLYNDLKVEFELLRDSVEKFTNEIDFQKYVDEYINRLLINRDIDKLIADLLAKNYNMNFLDVADVEIFAQNMPEDGVPRSSQGMDIGVINGIPYIACCLSSSEAENVQPQFTIYNMNTGEIVYTTHDDLLGHMNDVCFCSKDNKWYLTTDEYSRYYNRFNISTNTIEHILCPIEEFNYLHGITYNANDDLFYVYANTNNGRVLCKVNSSLTEIIEKVTYKEPNYNGWKDHGIYFDGVYLYKLNSRTTRDSKHSVFNHIEVYTSDMVYVKTINAPYAYEIEGMSYYNGKYYLSYNCYSRCGLIFKGDLFSTNDSYHTRDGWITQIGVERWATQYTCYVGNYETAGFLCDNTKEHPFCHVWAGIGYLTDVNKTYATIELVSDTDCEFICYGQTFTNLHIKGNGFKWNGYVKIENVIDFHCENLTVVSNNSWCLFINGVQRAVLADVSCDTMGGETAINCYDSNITFSGEYFNTATTTFVNSNRLVNLRFNAMPTSGATTFGCSTYVMGVHDIKTHVVCGHSLYDTTLNSGDDVKDIWRNGTFLVQNDNVPIGAYANRNAVIIATNIGDSGTKLEWFDRTRLNTQKDIAVAYRIVDHETDFDSGWIDIRRNYNMLSTDNINFYIDSETGDDLNSGTRDKPFATLNRFFDEYCNYAEIRCVFIGNGNNYVLDKYETLNSIGCHFVNESNNSTINITWKGVWTPACYNCHINIGGTVDKNFNIIIPNKLYFDGGFGLIANYATFTGNNLDINGGHGKFDYCTFDGVRVGGYGGNISLRSCVFKNGTQNACIDYNYGTVSIRTSIDVSEATPKQSILHAIECTIHQDVTLRNTNIAGLQLQNCIINGSDAKLDSWDANGSLYYTTTLLGDTYRYKNNGV